MYQPGDKIGPYSLVKRLGQGSFGVVWLAHDSSSIVRDHVALKLPIGDEIDSEKMRREAVLWLRASGHPNIVPVIDARIYQDQVAIVTEYVAGGTLAQRLDQNGGKAASVEWAVAITAGVLKGLEHLHSLNMVHRDLKPSNVMLDGEVPRLTDFGLVRILRSSARNRPSDGAGTFPYTAPEMFRGAFSEQSDVWSAGVILYQMLTGAVPFPQEHNAEIMYAICNTDAPALPETVPERVRRIVAQALDRDLNRRYPTARAIREGLAPYAASDLLNKSMIDISSVESTMHIAKAASASTSSAPLYDLPGVGAGKEVPLQTETKTQPNDLFGVPVEVKALEEKAEVDTPVKQPPPRRKNAVPAAATVLALAVCGVGAFVWLRGKHPATVTPVTIPAVIPVTPGPSAHPETGVSVQPGAAANTVPGAHPDTGVSMQPGAAANTLPGADPAKATGAPGSEIASSTTGGPQPSPDLPGAAGPAGGIHSGTTGPGSSAVKNTGSTLPIKGAEPGASKSGEMTGKTGVEHKTAMAGKVAGTTASHSSAIAHTKTTSSSPHAKAVVKHTETVKRHDNTEDEARRARQRRQAEREAEAKRNRRSHTVKATAKVQKQPQHKAAPLHPDQGDNGRQ